MTRLRKIVLAIALFLFTTLVVNSTGPRVLASMSTYAETQGYAPVTLAAGKHHNDPKNVERRTLQKQFAAQQKAQRKAIVAQQKARDKPVLKTFRRTVQHNPDLSKNQQKSIIKAFAADLKAQDKRELADLKAQEKAARKANNATIKEILRRFAG